MLYRPTTLDRVATGGTYLFDRGVNHTPRYHQGVDWPVGAGTPVYASGTGKVRTVANTGSTSGFGLYVIVDYANGYAVLVAHLKRVDVAPSQQVVLTTQLGLSGGLRGTFGAGASTGPHVHTELYLNGKRIDPMNLTSRSAIAGGTGTPIPPTPAPPIRKRKFMYGFMGQKSTGAIALFGDQVGFRVFPHPDDYNMFYTIITMINAKMPEADKLPQPPVLSAGNFIYFEDNAWAYIRNLFSNPAVITPEAIAAAVAKVLGPVDIDEKAIADQIIAALPAASMAPDVTPADIEALKLHLGELFAEVNANIDDAPDLIITEKPVA